MMGWMSKPVDGWEEVENCDKYQHRKVDPDKKIHHHAAPGSKWMTGK